METESGKGGTPSDVDGILSVNLHGLLLFTMDAEEDDDIYATGGTDGDDQATRKYGSHISAQQAGNEPKPADLEEGEEEDEDAEESDSVLGSTTGSIRNPLRTL